MGKKFAERCDLQKNISMKGKAMRSKLVICIFLLLLFAVACQPSGGTQAPSTPEVSSSGATPGSGQGKCGDGLCENPENKNNCPQDCEEGTTSGAGKCGDGLCESPETQTNCPADCTSSQPPSAESGDVCMTPNPLRAHIKEDIETWHNWLEDGSFEEGITLLAISKHPDGSLSMGKATRASQAARTGSFGYLLETGPSEGLSFSVTAYVDKGDDVRYSFWARSPGGEISLQPVVYAVKQNDPQPPTPLDLPPAAKVGTDWTQVSFTIHNENYGEVVLALEITSNTTLHVDDFAVEENIWQMASYPEGEGRIVGGIPVPNQPVAPVHFSVLIHIEDPAKVTEMESYFWQETTRMRELARVLYEHGGFLTIQPEEDWALASDIWSPGLLGELVRDYHVVFSTHTHGPHCRDDTGRLRSYSDCNDNRDNPTWDQTPDDTQNPWVVEYVRNLRDVLARTSNTQVTDHNGNWEFAQGSTFSEIPMLTWSAYKNFRTQETFNELFNNPWRPADASADAQTAKFQTYDPDSPIIYIPGYGQNIANNLEHLNTKLPPLLSQFIYYADPDRVNTAYIVTHVGSFDPQDHNEDAYLPYNQKTKDVVFSEEFKGHLADWEQVLTEVIDPLVAEGYLQWTSLPDMGDLFVEWEANCNQ
jgi:hypothetical protein